MKLTTNLLKDPRTLAITMAASAFLLAAMAIYQTSTTKTQRIAVADMQSIMDAQKLVWVQKMRLGEKTQVIASSREFQQKIEGALTDLTVGCRIRCYGYYANHHGASRFIYFGNSKAASNTRRRNFLGLSHDEKGSSLNERERFAPCSQPF